MGERERHQIWAFKNGHSNDQIGPQGAEKQLRKVRVGGWVVVGGCLAKDQNSSCSESDQISGACQLNDQISEVTKQTQSNFFRDGGGFISSLELGQVRAAVCGI